MASFDIVSEIDLQEVDNALNQAQKEIGTRFDFKGSKSTIDFDKAAKKIKITADDDMKLRTLHQILETKFSKRSLDLRCMVYGDAQEATGNTIRQDIQLKSGLEKDDAKKITKKIKELGLKVQAQIQDQQVRVTAKKIDDLQAVISALKESDVGLPLQYINQRS